MQKYITALELISAGSNSGGKLSKQAMQEIARVALSDEDETERFYVQREFGGNWENWSMGDDEKTPAYYASFDEAVAASNDHIDAQKGRVSDPEKGDELRIVCGNDVYEFWPDNFGGNYIKSDDALAFIDYWNLVDDELKNHWDVDTASAKISADDIAAAQDAGDAPHEFAKWYGEENKLTPRKAA